jgi:hypothetical protein
MESLQIGCISSLTQRHTHIADALVGSRPTPMIVSATNQSPTMAIPRIISLVHCSLHGIRRDCGLSDGFAVAAQVTVQA